MTQEELRKKVEAELSDFDPKHYYDSDIDDLMKLINQYVAEVIGEVEEEHHERHELRAEQRKRAGL